MSELTGEPRASRGRPHILQVSAGLIPTVGGPFASTLGLSEGFGGLDVDRRLIGPVELPGQRVDADLRDWLASNFPLTVVASNIDPRLRISAEFRASLESEIRGSDYVITHGWFTAATRATAVLATRLNVPFFIQLHGSSADSGSALRRLRRRAFNGTMLRPARGASGVIVASETEEADFARWGLGIPTFTLRYALPPLIPHPGNIGTTVQTTLDAVSDAPVILFIGRVVPQKRLDILIRALAVLQVRGFVSHLLVAGPVDDSMANSLRKLAADAGVAERVHFTGAVWGPEKERLFDRAELLSLASDSRENLGIVVLEAMSKGLPVVARSTVGSARLVADADAGIVVDSTDPEAWAEAMSAVLRDPALRAHMGQRGRDYATRNLSWTRSAADLLGFMREVTSVAPRY